ncbi:TMEM175 family protein [Subtercola sp. YIM 133946]|uniref:TMEM175 family protein n=1 Tax=Subtercola sp. YIM 133946 TaxID=3118909 RepID=UPI002F937434
MSNGADDSERDLGRLVTFTDAVVAIAITLIVLPLVESAREHATEPAIAYLRSDALNILAAALSFLVIATFWKQHHRLYKHVDMPTHGLVNANLLWVAGIIFLPVPSVLNLGNPDADALGSAIYIVTIIVTQVGVRIQELLLVRANCFEPGYAPVARYLWAHWITVALTVVALVLTIVFPNLGPLSLAVLLLARPINRAVRRGETPIERSQRIL